MEEELIGIKNSAVSLILEAVDPKEIEEIKIQFLGRSGRLTTAIKEIPKLSKEKIPDVGRLANEVKKTIEETLEEKDATLRQIKTQRVKRKK